MHCLISTMASASPNSSCSTLLNNPFTSSSAFYYHKLLSRTSFPFSLTPTITPHKTISIICCSAGVSITPKGVPFTSRFRPDEPRKGCDVLVEALEREGVTTLFGYPGGTTLEIHQALTRCPTIRNILPRHEQGGIFAAEGYARATGFPGVCMATSGPGATNLISGLADAMLDSIPIVAITGQLINPLVG